MNNDKKEITAELAKSIQLIEVNSDPALIPEAGTLLFEYGDYMYRDLGLTAGKESFFKQLAHFPGDSYLPPSGIFIVAKERDTLIGCVGIKKFKEQSCELKRLYIRPKFRGKGIGNMLCNFVIEWCRNSGYRRILLDTNIEMAEAIALYRKCGFNKIEPYCINENDHPVFYGVCVINICVILKRKNDNKNLEGNNNFRKFKQL